MLFWERRPRRMKIHLDLQGPQRIQLSFFQKLQVLKQSKKMKFFLEPSETIKQRKDIKSFQELQVLKQSKKMKFFLEPSETIKQRKDINSFQELQVLKQSKKMKFFLEPSETIKQRKDIKAAETAGAETIQEDEILPRALRNYWAEKRYISLLKVT